MHRAPWSGRHEGGTSPASTSMAVWSVAIREPDPFSGRVVWAPGRSWLCGAVGSGPARLAWLDRWLGSTEGARCRVGASASNGIKQCDERKRPCELFGLEEGKEVSAWGHDYDPRRPVVYEREVTADTVSNLCQQGRVAEAVEGLGVLVQMDGYVSTSLCYAVLKGCGDEKDLVLGRRVHGLAVEMGYQSDTFLCNHILRLYASHGRLQEAMDVFTVVGKPDAFMWSSVIDAHVKHGEDKQAIELYHGMRLSDVKPDGHVFVAALQACARGTNLKAGQQVHADFIASGVEPDLFVSSCLVDMYAKCGSLAEARIVFDGLGRKNVVTWTALIAGYSQQGMGQEALRLHIAMQEEGLAVPNSVTFVCLLQACASVGISALAKGKQLHEQIRDRRLQGDSLVANSLVNMYVKCGSLEDAQRVFDGLAQKDVVAWTALIAGYSQQGMGQQALHLYCLMQEEGITLPSSVTFVCLLQACASVGTSALEMGKQLHAQIREQGHHAEVFVSSSLVNMYTKCGSLQDAQNVFDRLAQKDVVTWTALIAGYSQQGMGQKALRLYSDMQNDGIALADSVTFACLLQACAEVAALHLGRQLHVQIEEQGLLADPVLAHSLINMYGKSGSIVDAQQVFDALLERDVFAWSSLIAGYACQGDSEVVFDLVLRMREDGIMPVGITYISLLTVCSHAGLVNEGLEYFRAMSGQFGISPTVEHYTCMVDLLGRAGRLDEALGLVRTMPVPPNSAIWSTLMSACRKWGNLEVGLHIFEESMNMDMKDAAAYVLMSNIYTGARMWEQAEELQARRKSNRAWKHPGRSWWTDLEGRVHTFSVGVSKRSNVH